MSDQLLLVRAFYARQHDLPEDVLYRYECLICMLAAAVAPRYALELLIRFDDSGSDSDDASGDLPLAA